MIYQGGKKCFSIYRVVKYSMVHGHITELREIYRSIFNDVILERSKIDIKSKVQSNGQMSLTFTAAFGIRRYFPDVLKDIITRIVDASLHTLYERNHKKIIEEKMCNLKEDYAEYRRNKPKAV